MAGVGLISTYRDSSQAFLIYSEVGVTSENTPCKPRQDRSDGVRKSVARREGVIERPRIRIFIMLATCMYVIAALVN